MPNRLRVVAEVMVSRTVRQVPVKLLRAADTIVENGPVDGDPADDLRPVSPLPPR